MPSDPDAVRDFTHAVERLEQRKGSVGEIEALEQQILAHDWNTPEDRSAAQVLMLRLMRLKPT